MKNNVESVVKNIEGALEYLVGCDGAGAVRSRKELRAARKQVKGLVEAVQEAYYWNHMDLVGIDDISPNEEMLENREGVLKGAILGAGADLPEVDEDEGVEV